jgi:hypothetical protein
MTYITERESFGRMIRELDIHRLATDVAPMVGGVPHPGNTAERDRHWGGRVIMPSGVVLLFSALPGSKFGRAEVRATYPHEITMKVPAFGTAPVTSIDAERSLTDIARQIESRVLKPAAEMMMLLEEKVATFDARRAEGERNAEAIRVGIPGMTVEFKKGSDLEAVLNMPGPHSRYFIGRMSYDGSVSIDRIGSIPMSRAIEFLPGLLKKDA